MKGKNQHFYDPFFFYVNGGDHIFMVKFNRFDVSSNVFEQCVSNALESASNWVNKHFK